MQFLQAVVLASLVMFASAQHTGTWSPSAMPSCLLSWEVSNDGRSVRFNVTVPITIYYNISIYICTTGRFQRTLHFQVTINFAYEILKHFKASSKGSEKHSSRI